MVVADRDAAVEAVETLLAYLPDNVDAEPERWPRDDPAGSVRVPKRAT